MESRFEDGKFGGTIFTHTKLSNEEIENVPPSSIAFKWLNEGVILKTYFGHGSVELVQFQNLESPSTIDNDGRMPIMNAWGCKTGNCFLTHDRSLGERNVFAPNKAAISYSATDGIGFISSIGTFGRDWYDLMSNDLMGQPIGLINQAAFERNKNTNINTVQQLRQNQISSIYRWILFFLKLIYIIWAWQ